LRIQNKHYEELDMIKKLAIATLISAGAFFSYGASATCTQLGKVERVHQTSTTTWIYILPITSLSSSFYYWTSTTDPELQRAIHAAKDGNHYVEIRGSAGTCPTTGTARWVGALTTVVRH
jgi:hypothetical protein